MDKKIDLKAAGNRLRILLEQNKNSDDDANRLLTWLKPLLDKIDGNEITPPYKYPLLGALGKDCRFYDKYPDVRLAEANFIAVLEDWVSQPWFKQTEK
jgi:hypothetical protein